MTSQAGGERPLHLKSSPQAAAHCRLSLIRIIFNNTCSLNYWHSFLSPGPFSILAHTLGAPDAKRKYICTHTHTQPAENITEQHITLQTFCWLDLLTFWTWNIARRAMIYRVHFAKCLRAAREVNTLVALAAQRGNSFCEKNAREWVIYMRHRTCTMILLLWECICMTSAPPQWDSITQCKLYHIKFIYGIVCMRLIKRVHVFAFCERAKLAHRLQSCRLWILRLSIIHGECVLNTKSTLWYNRAAI